MRNVAGISILVLITKDLLIKYLEGLKGLILMEIDIKDYIVVG